MKEITILIILTTVAGFAFADSLNVGLVGHIDTPVNTHDVFIAGSYAYVADAYDGIHIFDVSTPSSPTEVGFYDTGGGAHSVCVSGSLAYVANDWRGLKILDISTPSSPTEIGYYDYEIEDARQVIVSGSLAYLKENGDFSAWLIDTLLIIDVSTPSSPSEVGLYEGSGPYYVSGSYLYFVTDTTGLSIIDISSPSSPTEIGFYDYDMEDACNVYVDGDYAYVADSWDGGIRIIDVSNPTSPAEIGSYTAISGARDVYVSDSLAYVSSAMSSYFHVIDVSNPSLPTEVGFYDIGSYSLGDVVVSGSFAYVTDQFNGVYILDVSCFTGIEEGSTARPEEIAIRVIPNPFNSAVTISAPENAIVEIFDINGRSIAEFGGGDQIWKPEASVGSGIYLVRAKIGEKNITKRVVYLK